MLLQCLEGELITDGKLDDAVLALLVTILVNLSQTKVVATVYHNVIKLVRDAKGNREIESLAIILRSYIHALRRANAINLHVGSQQEARLNTSLDSQALNDVEVTHDGNVQVVEISAVTIPTFSCRATGSTIYMVLTEISTLT